MEGKGSAENVDLQQITIF